MNLWTVKFSTEKKNSMQKICEQHSKLEEVNVISLKRGQSPRSAFAQNNVSESTLEA